MKSNIFYASVAEYKNIPDLCLSFYQLSNFSWPWAIKDKMHTNPVQNQLLLF